MRHTALMSTSASLYHRHRFPTEIISHCVWLYFRFALSLRYVPRTLITDKLRSYSAAKAEVLPSVVHLEQKYQNNRAENSHQPTRLRERLMRRFKSAGHAQRFLSAFGIITSHFRVGRHLYRASAYRAVMKSRFAIWEEAICVKAIVN